MSVSNMGKMFRALPIGSMIAVDKCIDVTGFMEVNGQELCKKSYQNLFLALRENVTDRSDTFVLPSAMKLKPMFQNFDEATMKIILKFC